LLLLFLSQMFLWRYMGMAYGYGSVEAARALVRGAPDTPLTRYDPNKDPEWRELRAMIAGLIRHGMWEEFLDRSPLSDREALVDHHEWVVDPKGKKARVLAADAAKAAAEAV
jgi:hypothetical protein